MTRFRILAETRADGKARYYVQQQRFWLYWSNTYFYSSGAANYNSYENTLEQAEVLLQSYIKDTCEKVMSRPWNKIRHVVKHVEV